MIFNSDLYYEMNEMCFYTNLVHIDKSLVKSIFLATLLSLRIFLRMDGTGTCILVPIGEPLNID